MKRALFRILDTPGEPLRFRITVEGEEPKTYEWCENGLSVNAVEVALAMARRVEKPLKGRL